MRYPRDQCKLVSDRLPTRDAARRQSSHAGLAHRHIHKQMDGGHHPGTARQGYSTRTSRATSQKCVCIYTAASSANLPICRDLDLLKIRNESRGWRLVATS